VKIAESITLCFWFCAKYDTPRLLRSPPSQEGNYRAQVSLIGFLGESPLERGRKKVPGENFTPPKNTRQKILHKFVRILPVQPNWTYTTLVVQFFNFFFHPKIQPLVY